MAIEGIRRAPGVILGTTLVVLLIAACATTVTPTAPAGFSPASDETPAVEPTDAGGGAPGASVPVTFPHACDLLTAAEVGAAIGKSVGEGTAMGTLVCDWTSDPDLFGTELSLLLQPLGDEFCEPSLMGTPVSGIGRAATWEYSDSFDVPQGALAACVSGGLVLVTRTGDVGDPSQEAAYKDAVTALMTLVIERL